MAMSNLEALAFAAVGFVVGIAFTLLTLSYIRYRAAQRSATVKHEYAVGVCYVCSHNQTVDALTLRDGKYWTCDSCGRTNHGNDLHYVGNSTYERRWEKR